MERSSNDIESYLTVGLVAYLHPRTAGNEKVRFKTVVRGWHKGSHILLETPQGEGKLPIFIEELPCTIRFLHEGYACGFETRILECGRIGGLGYGRVSWPREVETVRVRKHSRMPTAIPCTVQRSNGKEFKGVIDDLSAGGCCIRSQKAAPPSNQEVVALHFVLPDGTAISGIPATVRRVQSTETGTLLGCEFAQDDDSRRQEISFYVITTLEHARGGTGDSQRVLVIDSSKPSATTLSLALRNLQVETFVATGVVDAFYRLRTLNPVAVFIGYEQNEVPATQLCRIVKSTKGLEKTLVFVYGSDSMAIHDEALEAGADGFFSAAGKVAGVRAALARFAPPPDPEK